DGDRLVDLPEQLVEAEDVAVRRSDVAIERAEIAFRDADVRVVHVAVDDVGDDVVGMLARADGVGEAAEESGRRGAVQLERLVSAHALTRANAVSDLLNRPHDTSASFRRTQGRVPARPRIRRTSSNLRTRRCRESTEYYRVDSGRRCPALSGLPDSTAAPPRRGAQRRHRARAAAPPHRAA